MTSEFLTAREVQVGPFRLHDVSQEGVVERLVDLAVADLDAPAFAFALHVGGLNERRDPAFVEAMAAADVVYADGGSVVWLAHLAGAERLDRAPTTDVGWKVLRGFAVRTGRRPRVALLGGVGGLAARAGAVLSDAGVADVVLTDHGYHEDWQAPLAEVRESLPDVLVVGLGAPLEMVWAVRHRSALPACVTVTCGGWFGHLVGDEKRAPQVLRRSGLEWIARVAQAPRRLGPRYARGAATTARLAIEIRRERHVRQER